MVASVAWMKRLALCLLLLGAALGLQAQTLDAEFLQIYRVIQEAEVLEKGGQAGPAMDRYQEARRRLEEFSRANPNWNPTIIGFRRRYLEERSNAMKGRLAPSADVSATPVPSAAGPAVAEPSAVSSIPGVLRAAGGVPSDAAVLAHELSVARTRMNDAEARAEAAKRRADELAVEAQQANDRSSQLALDLRQARDRVEVLEAAQRNLERFRDQLDADRSTLEAKLREALSPKPAALDPIELAKAEERNRLLMKENAILKAGLEHQLAENAKVLAMAQTAGELERELTAVKAELAAQQRHNAALEARWTEARTAMAATREEAESREAMVLRGEIESLRKELAAARAAGEAESATGSPLSALQAELAQQRMLAAELWRENSSLLRELQMVSPIRVTPASLKVAELPGMDLPAAEAARLHRLERERQELRGQLEVARAELRRREDSVLEARTQDLTRQVNVLQARVRVLEAAREPYTAEELALFKAPAAAASPSPIQVAQATPSGAPSSGSPAAPTTPAAPATPPATPVPSAPAGVGTAPAGGGTVRRRTEADLPPGSGILAERARRAFAQRRLDEAEKAYRGILELDPANVYTLGNLSLIVVEQGRLEEGEELIQRALKVDAQDPYSLFVLGNIRWRQKRLDEALNLLSRSAALDPDNEETQVFLGITLSGLGQRSAAEAALRKAIKLNPGSAMAHYNLAVVYATQKPPFLEMARFHYDRARRAGQPANPAFEALIRDDLPAPAPAGAPQP